MKRTISEVAREAREAGLNYGLYIYRYGDDAPNWGTTHKPEPSHKRENSRNHERYCTVCGKRFRTSQPTAKYCPDCRTEAQYAKNKEWHRQNKAAKKPPTTAD